MLLRTKRLEGVRQAEISRLERGPVGLPRRARLERIAAALKLTLVELLARSDRASANTAFHAQLESARGSDVAPDQHPVNSRETEQSRVSPELLFAIEQARETIKRTESRLAQSHQTYERVCRSISRVPSH